jgi:hypothetical protein
VHPSGCAPFFPMKMIAKVSRPFGKLNLIEGEEFDIEERFVRLFEAHGWAVRYDNRAMSTKKRSYRRRDMRTD